MRGLRRRAAVVGRADRREPGDRAGAAGRAAPRGPGGGGGRRPPPPPPPGPGPHGRAQPGVRANARQPAYRQFAGWSCPEAERWAAECLTVPCFPELTDDEVDTVAGALAEIEP